MSTGLDDLPPPPAPPPRTAVSVAGPAPAEDAAQAGARDAEFGSPPRTCANCGAPVHGPYCYACGQSEKSMVRSLREVFDDLADIVFNIDSRIFRSLFDLYFRPGFLTTEYFEGRRARYVTPFRLFFVLSLVAFFAMHAVIDFDGRDGVLSTVGESIGGRLAIDRATTPAEVDAALERGIATLKSARERATRQDAAREAFDEAARDLREDAAQRKLRLTLIDPAIARVDAAGSPGEVDAAVEAGLAEVRAAMAQAEPDSAERRELERAQDTLQSAGADRKAALEAEDPAAPALDRADRYSCPDVDFVVFPVNGKPWNAESNRVAIAWLPDAANAKFNDMLAHTCDNLSEWKADRRKAYRAVFSVLPQTLFFLMPWFALLLKLFYLFKRRLYMEHLLVALHSHAFLLLSIIVLLALSTLRSWAGGVAWITAPLGWLMVFAWTWAFVYLYWMQKRVYRQGWIMTSVKFCLIGWCYAFLLGFGAIFAIAVSLAVT